MDRGSKVAARLKAIAACSPSRARSSSGSLNVHDVREIRRGRVVVIQQLDFEKLADTPLNVRNDATGRLRAASRSRVDS